MHPRSCTCVALTALGLLAAGAGPPRPSAPAPERARRAAERGLAFLERDAANWRKERKCASCHHGTMTVWALTEAKSQGYPVAAETLADVMKWTRERLGTIDQPRDTRPGWSMEHGQHPGPLPGGEGRG